MNADLSHWATIALVMSETAGVGEGAASLSVSEKLIRMDFEGSLLFASILDMKLT